MHGCADPNHNESSASGRYGKPSWSDGCAPSDVQRHWDRYLLICWRVSNGTGQYRRLCVDTYLAARVIASTPGLYVGYGPRRQKKEQGEIKRKERKEE